MSDADRLRRNAVTLDIYYERDRQNKLWGEQNHEPLYWLGILMEEVGEAAREAIEHKKDHPTMDRFRKEMVQVAAVALQILECCDRNEWVEQ